ncbi:unnamed protein product [Debaryomyces tyrocola]|nr:unnamed protein product [Debaryomyces tyrocola]
MLPRCRSVDNDPPGVILLTPNRRSCCFSY